MIAPLNLREQLDLDALSAELLAVVDQTVQPTQASADKDEAGGFKSSQAH